MVKQKPALPFHERLLALGLAGFFICLVVLNLMLDEGQLTPGVEHYPKNPLIEISVEGKVHKPGTYQVEKGTRVAQVILLSEPYEDANLKRLNLEAMITRRRKIVVR